MSYCRNLSGNLFYALDGTTAQLDFLFEKSDFVAFWIGISRDNSTSAWTDLDGNEVDESTMVWSTNQVPYNGDENVIAAGEQGVAIGKYQSENLLEKSITGGGHFYEASAQFDF